MRRWPTGSSAEYSCGQHRRSWLRRRPEFTGLIFFVSGCLIYTITKQAWSQTFLLVLIEAGIMEITIGTGIIESLVDAALMGIAGI